MALGRPQCRGVFTAGMATVRGSRSVRACALFSGAAVVGAKGGDSTWCTPSALQQQNGTRSFGFLSSPIACFLFWVWTVTDDVKLTYCLCLKLLGDDAALIFFLTIEHPRHSLGMCVLCLVFPQKCVEHEPNICLNLYCFPFEQPWQGKGLLAKMGMGCTTTMGPLVCWGHGKRFHCCQQGFASLLCHGLCAPLAGTCGAFHWRCIYVCKRVDV